MEKRYNEKKYFFIFIIVITSLIFSSCIEKTSNINLWDNATYHADTELGNGEKNINLKVTADEKSVNFKIFTDKDILGDVLAEHNLISGENGPYGIYIKGANGIEADYEKDHAFWALYKNGESMMTGVDQEEVSSGNTYEFIYSKQ